MFDKVEYNKIISALKGKTVSFSEAIGLSEFVVIRHDVEFSVEHAYMLACWEKEQDFNTSFFFQVASDAYNALSHINAQLIRDIKAMGHEIGLHYYVQEPFSEIDLEKQRDALSDVLGEPVAMFSYHRPHHTLLIDAPLYMSGMINVYAKHFFTYSDDPRNKFDVKYCADSRRRWDYGHPLECIEQYNKVHILIHPDYWSNVSQSTMDNALSLAQNNKVKFANTLISETKHFKPYSACLM